MIDLAVLGLLKEQPLHGYELKKRLGDVLGPVSSVSFGSLYPCLARLERDGAVVVMTPVESAPPVPSTGSLAAEAAALRTRRRPTRDGRGKKVYAITDVGEERLKALLEGEPDRDDDRSFRVRLAFSRYLPASRRVGLFERRRARLLERLEAAQLALRRAGEELDPYTRSLMEHETQSTQNDIAWLERLIADERDADRLDPTGGSPS